MLAREGCSLEPKLFPCYHIMCKQITLHCVYNERLLVNLHVNSLRWVEMREGKEGKGQNRGKKRDIKRKVD